MADDLKKIKCPVKLLYGLDDTEHKIEEGILIKE